MEPLAFKRGMTELMDQGLDVEVMATDRSTSIQKLMREDFHNVQHEFDIWHTAKGFRKKMHKKAKKKGNEILLAWTRSVLVSVSVVLKCRWKSILQHVRNEHEWTDDDGEHHRCDHAPLTAQERRLRMWLKEDSLAFQDLSSLVLDKRLLRDMEKMALFKHTGPLEVFHSPLLKYIPKRKAFPFQGMRERCHLAILEHNENIVKRKQATTKTGELRFNRVFCKRSKQWVLKKIFTPHSF
ncbi:hypothetical protein UPYG_G00206540 [Umbra pygmaea]|uniref:Uncharacterized protein n=1 Tax=Umbra pygmaea TaxID=75934 RepID=A0ABD0WP99_UMBPY